MTHNKNDSFIPGECQFSGETALIELTRQNHAELKNTGFVKSKK